MALALMSGGELPGAISTSDQKPRIGYSIGKLRPKAHQDMKESEMASTYYVCSPRCGFQVECGEGLDWAEPHQAPAHIGRGWAGLGWAGLS